MATVKFNLDKRSQKKDGSPIHNAEFSLLSPHTKHFFIIHSDLNQLD